MNTGERLREFRKSLGLTQADFGEKIGFAPTAIGQMETQARNITDRTFLLLGQEYNLNIDWLKTGIGEPFDEPLEEDELAAYCGEICSGRDPFIAAAILEYMRLDKDSKETVKKLVKNIAIQY